MCTLFCVPLFFGYCNVCIRLIRGESCPLSELFSPYSSLKELGSVYAFFLKSIPAIIFKLIVPPLALTALYYALGEYTETFAGTELLLLFNGLKLVYFVPAILIILWCMYLFGKNIRGFLYFCNKDEQFPERQKGSFSFYKLRLSLIPLYLLSFLTFGILFIVYTIPITVIVYSLFLGLDENSLTENTDQDETVIFDALTNKAPEYESNGDTAVFEINDKTENN